MRTMRTTIQTVLSVAGIAGLLAVSAQPLLRVWDERNAAPQPKAWTSPDGPVTQTWSPHAPTEILVDLKDSANAAEVQAVAAEYGLELRPNSVEAQDNKLMRAVVKSGGDTREAIARLKADPRVEAAEMEQIYSLNQDVVLHSSVRDGQVFTFRPTEPSRNVTLDAPGKFPNDPRYSEQWNFEMIGAESAWKRTRGKGVVVAVIDTGVAGGPVKKGKVCRDFGATTFVDGYDFVNNNKDAWDDHGHGTHVAGTIAESTNNNEGVAGLAFEATIMPLKVLSAEGYGNSADIADAIRWAADKGANVINMSLGSQFPSDVIHKAVKYAAKKGVVIVCAAGNGFGAPVGYPAAFPECIAVSAVGPTSNIAKYSSYGKEVALAAPGGDMIDSGNAADGILQNTNYPESQGGKGDDYYAFQGTSMASPHVAAAAALVYSQGITDPAKVRDILVKSATPKDDKNKYGAGVLNVAQATAKAEQLQGVKLRHFLAFALALPILFVGATRRLGLRLTMLAALWAGFFGPDLATYWLGADSAWNLLTFSAVLPVAAYLLLRNGLGVKVAGSLALGTAVNLYANWHNGTLPFTAATFGEAALPWTAVNLVLAIGVGVLAARRVLRNG
jgi:serine protease